MSHPLHQAAGLLAFVQAVESGSFSAAARIIRKTPSAISKSVGDLELALGARLFRRSTRALDLTPEGQVFFDKVAPHVRGIEDSAGAIRPASGAVGLLRVSMPSELGRLLMPAVTARFLTEHPDLALDLALGDQHVDLIRDGYDLALRVGRLQPSELVVRTLAQLDMVLVAAPALLRSIGEPDSVQALQAMPFVRYVVRGRLLPVVFDDGTQFVPQGRITLDSGFGLRAAAMNAMGVAYLLKCTVRPELDRGELVQVLPGAQLPKLPLQALHAFGRLVPARVRLFADFIAREVQRIGD